jgi:hypothetical protein
MIQFLAKRVSLRLAVSVILLTNLSLYVVGVEDEGHYGVDVSFPIHHHWTESSTPLNEERKVVYENFMNGCREKYGARGRLCDETENDRIEMSLRQPQSMVNYTSTGYMKIRAPEAVRKLLNDHWEKNKRKQEVWSAGNIYVNHWESETYMANVEDSLGLRQKIWEAAKDTIEQWTGMELQPTSMYGIRVYTEGTSAELLLYLRYSRIQISHLLVSSLGAILSPHVDRLPLVSSCIVNVAQDVDEPWPLEIYDREGNAVNVTMEPGDMVLYESGSLIHGRPFPLKGRYFANIFIHFEPTGRHIYHRSDEPDDALSDDFPPYIIRGSPEEQNWRRRNPTGWKMASPSATQVDVPEGHLAAAKGDVDRLAEIAVENARLLHQKDRNGWQPIHEAARSGHEGVISLLVANGVDYNVRTHNGQGSTPLNIAINALSEKHPVSQYLLSLGALDIGPDL